MSIKNLLAGLTGKSKSNSNVALCDDMEIVNSTMTIRELCRVFDTEIPAKYSKYADKPRTLAFRPRQVKKGDVCLIIRSAEELKSPSLTSKTQYELAIEKGARLVIMDRKAFAGTGLSEKKCKVILVDNLSKKVDNFFDIVRKKNGAKIVMLTGSVGKTTTKDFCYAVTKNQFKTFANVNNTNTLHQAAKHLFLHCDDKNEIHIQETGAGYNGSLRIASNFLKPDIFILTNVYSHHLQAYGTMENLFADKTAADDFMADNGIIITNFDDEQIKNHKFKHKVISFAINNEDAYYRAINICQDMETLKFDIVEKGSEHIVPIKINVLGIHNVYNALAAFALAKALGVEESKIQEDFLLYKASGIRQNFTNVGGIHIDMDCYNVAEESITAMLKAGEEFELGENAKKIALIGGENKIGEGVEERSENFGEKLADIKFDSILFCGRKRRTNASINRYGDALSIQKGFNKYSNVKNSLALNVDDMIDFLKNNVSRGDLLMVKGIYYLDMPIAVDKVFGTSYSFGLSHYKEDARLVKEDGVRGKVFDEFGEIELSTCKADENGNVAIPNKIKAYPVFRLKKNLYLNNEDVKSVDFGTSIKNIGEAAFKGCVNLQEINIPDNVKIVEDRAFCNCTSLKKVVIGNGTIHIGNEAFENCHSLSEIHIPDSVGKIGFNALKNAENCTIICNNGSYAMEYAIENNLKYQTA